MLVKLSHLPVIILYKGTVYDNEHCSFLNFFSLLIVDLSSNIINSTPLIIMLIDLFLFFNSFMLNNYNK